MRVIFNKTSFSILLALYVFSFANQLHGVNDFYSSSQVLYSHCSLIPHQKYYPSSCELSFSSKSKTFDLRYASLFSFRDNGFAFGYERLSNRGNILSSAYGMKNDFFSFGAAFKVYFNSASPLLLVNVSSAIDINDERIIVLSVNNIGELTKEKLFPEVTIETAGLFSQKFPFGYNAAIRYITETSNIKKGTSELSIDFKGRISNRPYFFYSAGYKGIYERMNIFHHCVTLALGSTASFNDNGVSLLFGYQYDIFLERNTIQCGVQYNPLEFSDNIAPEPEMTITCRSDNEEGYFISLNCNDNDGGTGLKSWTMVFADKPSKQGNIYKIFSGGNTIPSTIYWDLRNKDGIVLDTLDFYSRLVAIDKKNNIGATSWIKVNRCK